MPAIYFTSDLHLGHKKVSELRGYSSVADHDHEVYKELARLPVTSTLYVLGDVTLGHILKYTDLPLPMYKHLITGNHDQLVDASLKNPHLNSFRNYLEIFDTISNRAEIRTSGLRIQLSHYPYAGDHTEEDRYDQLRLPDLGNPLIHGHSHSYQQLSFSPSGTPQVNVCWEAWGRPVTLKEIMRLLNKAKSAIL